MERRSVHNAVAPAPGMLDAPFRSELLKRAQQVAVARADQTGRFRERFRKQAAVCRGGDVGAKARFQRIKDNMGAVFRAALELAGKGGSDPVQESRMQW